MINPSSIELSLDIAGSSAFCNEEDSLTRYMISICVSFNHLKDDPRCPVRIDKDDHLQYYIISKRNERRKAN